MKMSEKKETVNIVAGIDIGNGYTKGKIVEPIKDSVDLPSAMAYYDALKKIEESRIPEVVNDIYNQMQVTIDSPSLGIKKDKKLIFGKRAVDSGISPITFDVNTSLSKASQDLSVAIGICVTAAAALKREFLLTKRLPEKTEVNATLFTALPIDEFQREHAAYAKKFTDFAHTVKFHNFPGEAVVIVTFSSVKIISEGHAAQVAILADSELHMNSDPEVRKYSKAKNSLGIDIGEGTVNFFIQKGGRFSEDVSFTFPSGFGTALDRCLDALRDAGYDTFPDRRLLSDFLIETPSEFNIEKYNDVAEIVKKNSQMFLENLSAQFIKAKKAAGGNNEAIFVYGGGSAFLRPLIKERLSDDLKKSNDRTKIIFIKDPYARELNAKGLAFIANRRK